MIRSRVHGTLRDPAWWICIAAFTVVIAATLASDMQSGDGLYTESDLISYANMRNALDFFNQRFETSYESLFAFFDEFVPGFLADQAANRVIPAVANNSAALAFVWWFPVFFIGRRLHGVWLMSPVAAGRSRLRVFLTALAELVLVMYLVIDLTSLMALWPFLRGPGEVPGELIGWLMLLRPLMFLAWCMPMVLLTFLLQDMILSSVASFAALVVLTILNFKEPVLPFLGLRETSSWAVGQIGTLAYPAVAALIWIVLWALASYGLFRLRDYPRS